jgi:squalene synthase HpnC
MAVDHYENFPVASLLVPARLRAPIRAIYRFARTADDLADEGDAPPAQRLAALAALAAQLDRIQAGDAGAWPDLAAAVQAHALPIALLHALLSAFRQDVTVQRYPDEPALLDYCTRSANPVGRLLLHLVGRTEAPLPAWSDAICTGLQLTNFWQDVALDWRKQRVYLPQSVLRAHGVDEDAIARARADAAWQRLMRDRTADARARLHAGAALPAAVGGRMGLELRLVVQGGLRILECIDAVDGDVFTRRPRLRATDWATMFFRALRM